ncbi:hypothetical protein SHIRM173S_01418 [Streptomyces hirsutus]
MTEETGRPERDPEGVSRFVEHFAAQLVMAGMPRMPARVFAALLVSDTGAGGSAELGETLRISPAAVSGAVRYLDQQHLVSREREPGSRRERYRVHGDQWYEALTNREAVNPALAGRAARGCGQRGSRQSGGPPAGGDAGLLRVRGEGDRDDHGAVAGPPGRDLRPGVRGRPRSRTRLRE